MPRLRLKKQKKSLNKRFLFLTLAFTVLGLIAVADASAPQALSTFSDKFYFVKQQAVWAGIGLIALFCAAKIHYSFWEKIATPLFLMSLFLLGIVLLPQVGSKLLGARRWILLGPVSLQPSELIKLTLTIYLAKVAASKKAIVSYFVPLTVVAGLIMLQPDLGTTLVVVFSSMVQIFVSGVNLFYFLGAVSLGGLLSLLLIFVSPYRKDRLTTFLEASTDPLGKSYQIRQVLLAIGSGGLFGVGLGQSRQKYLFLPEATTDSIFAIIAEEIGFLGASLLLIFFAYYIFLGLKIARDAPDRFSHILGIGIISWIGGQIVLNIASMVGLTPLTGVPLPFFSYGGSALTMVLTAAGILLNISKNA